MAKPPPLPAAAAERPLLKLPCAMCGTLNPAGARCCRACGTIPALNTSKVILSRSLLGVAAMRLRAVVPRTLERTTPAISRSGGSRWMTWTCLAIALVGGVLGLAHRSGYLHLPHDVGVARRISGAPTAPAPPSSAGGLPAAERAPVDVTAGAGSVATAQIPPGMGLLNTADAPPGHRIFVDGRTLGQTPQPVLVRCGKASVKIGSAGRLRVLDVPCGAEIGVSP